VRPAPIAVAVRGFRAALGLLSYALVLPIPRMESEGSEVCSGTL
jgi:hypothetical protein